VLWNFGNTTINTESNVVLRKTVFAMLYICKTETMYVVVASNFDML